VVQQYPVPYKFLGGALSSAGVNFMALSLQLLEQGKLLLAVPLLVPLAGVRMCANEEVLAFSGRENPVGASVLHVMRPAHVFVLAIALFLGIAVAVEAVRVDKTALVVCGRVGHRLHRCESPASTRTFTDEGIIQLHVFNAVKEFAKPTCQWTVQPHVWPDHRVAALTTKILTRRWHCRGCEGSEIQRLSKLLVVVLTANLFLPVVAHFWVVTELGPIAGCKTVCPPSASFDVAFFFHDRVASAIPALRVGRKWVSACKWGRVCLQ